MKHALVTSRVISTPVVKSMGALLFACVIALVAQVRVPLPFTPVPMTLQTLALMIGSGILLRHYAIQMAAWYLLIGALGAPFFSGMQGGYSVILGPTGGYLIGFILAAAAIGYGADKVKKWYSRYALYLGASFLIFIPGVFQLTVLLRLSLVEGFKLGVAPFLIEDFLKVFVACTAATLWKRGAKNAG